MDQQLRENQLRTTLLLVGVFSVGVAIATLALVIYTVAGLVKVGVQVVKP